MFESAPNGYFLRDLIVFYGLRKGCYVSKGFLIEPVIDVLRQIITNCTHIHANPRGPFPRNLVDAVGLQPMIAGFAEDPSQVHAGVLAPEKYVVLLIGICVYRPRRPRDSVASATRRSTAGSALVPASATRMRFSCMSAGVYRALSTG